MLQDEGVDFEYRDYKADPLSEAELRSVLTALDVAPAAVLRKRDRAYRELGLTGTEGDEKLISLMALHPTLLERPVGVLGARAVVGRPPARLLTLLDD